MMHKMLCKEWKGGFQNDYERPINLTYTSAYCYHELSLSNIYLFCSISFDCSLSYIRPASGLSLSIFTKDDVRTAALGRGSQKCPSTQSLWNVLQPRLETMSLVRWVNKLRQIPLCLICQSRVHLHFHHHFNQLKIPWDPQHSGEK